MIVSHHSESESTKVDALCLPNNLGFEVFSRTHGIAEGVNDNVSYTNSSQCRVGKDDGMPERAFRVAEE